MAGLARGERLQIMLTDEELVALDDWRFDKRMPSRASAVRELLKRGLAAEGVALGGRLRSQISASSARRTESAVSRPRGNISIVPGGENDGRIFDCGWSCPGVDHEQ